MNIHLIGINHLSAKTDLRERFYLQPLERKLVLSELRNDPSILGAIVLSTCNRTEIAVHLTRENCNADHIYKLLLKIKGVKESEELKKHYYFLYGPQAINHIFKVSSGLASLVLGENQIINQVRSAFNLSREMSLLSREFNILDNFAIRTSRKIRRETHLNSGGTSVSWAAMKLAQDKIGPLDHKRILIVGAGKMGKLAGFQIRQHKVADFVVMSRTSENAELLANQFKARFSPYADLKEELISSDLCFCSTGAPHYIIDKPTITSVMKKRQNRALALIDVSIPRNIDPDCAKIKGVSVFSMDDLEAAVKNVFNMRKAEIHSAEEMIEDKTRAFLKKINHKRPSLISLAS